MKLRISPSLRALLISFATAVALVVYAATSAEPVLRVSLLPEESASTLRRKFKPLSDYLEKKIGMKVEFRPMADEAALIEALAANKLDMVWFSGLGFIQAKLRSHDQVMPLVQRAEDEQSQSVFITRRDDITKLEDLKGKTFSFGAETSTSDYLMPRSFLLAAHIDPDADMKQVVYSGAKDEVVTAVASGKADAGVLSSTAWRKLLTDGNVDPKVLHVFYTTPDYHNYNWTVRTDMDTNLRLKLFDAFLALDENVAIDKEILGLQHASQFVPAKAEDYAAIEAVARN